MARFPEHPTPEDSLALKTFMTLFGRLYPCGDCAEHFRKLLAKYPPQTSSRNAAAGWACAMHNEVNKRLQKELFDCTKIGDFYDCGCGDDDKKNGGGEAAGKEEELKGREAVSIEKEGLTRGG
jgi:FAD-linked sulfhydryl oxidase